MIDWNSVILGVVSSGVITAILTFFFNKRKVNKEIESSNVTDAKTVTDMQERALITLEKSYTNRIEELVKDKELMRQKIAELMVEVVDLKEQNAEKTGYINGISQPLVKLEEEQKAALKSGRPK